MDASLVAKIIRKRLKLEEDDWSMIEKNPRFQKLFQNAKDFNGNKKYLWWTLRHIDESCCGSVSYPLRAKFSCR